MTSHKYGTVLDSNWFSPDLLNLSHSLAVKMLSRTDFLPLSSHSRSHTTITHSFFCILHPESSSRPLSRFECKKSAQQCFAVTFLVRFSSQTGIVFWKKKNRLLSFLKPRLQRKWILVSSLYFHNLLRKFKHQWPLFTQRRVLTTIRSRLVG